MNSERRKKLELIRNELNDLAERIGSIRDEEQEAYDNMPEGIQAGDKGEVAQAAIDAMETVINDLENSIGELEMIS
jgi:antitoxin component HigA of HigAB toxin-antitoxin module